MDRSRAKEIGYAWLLTQRNIWATFELDRIIESQPDVALDIIEYMVSIENDRESLDMIGVGPIEELISESGTLVVDRIVSLVEMDEKFASCVAKAWKSTSDDEVWGRIQKALRKFGHEI